MKLSSFTELGGINITQSPHGELQNNCAFDFGLQYGKKLKAPCDGRLERKYGIGTQRGFHFVGDGFDILFHHDIGYNLGDYKRGQDIGESASDHHHIAIKVNGKWDWILNYMDRTVRLSFWSLDNTTNKWAKWETYQDLQLNPIINNTSMVKAIQLNNMLKLTSTNTVTFNIRLEANSSSKDIGDVPIGYTWNSNVIAEGESVNGNNKWYQIVVPEGEFKGYVGYCSAVWVKEEPVIVDCKPIENELKAITARVNDFKDLVSKTLESYKQL